MGDEKGESDENHKNLSFKAFLINLCCIGRFT